MVQGFRSRAVLVEQGDEPAADNGTGGMLLGRFQGLPVADAEADHTRMGQSHLVYTVEVGLFGAVELFLCTGSGSRRYHVDKTVRVPIRSSLVSGVMSMMIFSPWRSAMGLNVSI